MQAEPPANESLDLRVLSEDDAFDETVAALTGGGVVVLPTDTVYGVAACVNQPDAIDRIYQLKQRPANLAIALLVADVEQASLVARLSSVEHAVAAELWPGALTLVLRRRDDADPRLGRADGTVGLRSPASAFVRAVAAATGPLATTSANLSGSPTAPQALDAARSLAGAVDLVVDAGPSKGVASTVAKLDESGDVTIFRQGSVTEQQIRTTAAREKSG